MIHREVPKQAAPGHAAQEAAADDIAPVPDNHRLASQHLTNTAAPDGAAQAAAVNTLTCPRQTQTGWLTAQTWPICSGVGGAEGSGMTADVWRALQLHDRVTVSPMET